MGGDKPLFKYYTGIKNDLESVGCTVFQPIVPRYSDVYTRSERLRDQILEIHRTTKHTRFNLIGHSMGGLDARHFISNLEGYKITASLTTLSTPHHGSSCGDWFVTSLSEPLKLSKMGIKAHYNLTREFLANVFNPQTPNKPGVAYFSFGGEKDISVTDVLYIPSQIILKREGKNDGLVSVASSKWGEYVATLPLDHAEMINWGFTYDARRLFRSLVTFLAQQGF